MIRPLKRLATLDALAVLLRRSTPARLDWSEVLALATELDVKAALWAAVRDDQAAVPPAISEELREFVRGNTLRNVRLRDQLREAVAALNAVGIEPLLIKGALRLADGTLPRLGERWMSDLDLLVPRERVGDARAALEAAGYQAAPGRPFSHPHELPLHLAGRPGPVELHIDLGHAPLPTVLPTREAWEQSVALSDGAALTARGLSPTHQVLYGVLHSAVQDLNHAVHGLPLRQLLDLRALVEAAPDRIDWHEVRRRMADHDLEPVLLSHLWLAHRYAGLPALPVPWWGPRRRHDLIVRAGFALGWPADLRRNLRYAFGRDYLEELYGHGDRPARLIVARARHAIRLLRRDAGGSTRKALRRRN